MQRLHAEAAVEQLVKHGEELCGDKVMVVRTAAAAIVVLSDGLGSGVKANILATLTTKIACSMLKRGVALEDVVVTIAKTLPVCRQRKIAYSTFQIIQISVDGTVGVVEFDCPPTFFVRDGKVGRFPVEEKIVGGKAVKAGRLKLKKGDMLAAVSDGVLHAGMGGAFKFGWGWKGVSGELARLSGDQSRVDHIAKRIIACCRAYYGGKPGDDSSVAVIRIQQASRLALLTGPPADRGLDDNLVSAFLLQPGKKVVAGGATADMVSRITGRPLSVDLSSAAPNVPPMGYIEGIDLVTEGILTLNAAIDRLQDMKWSGDYTRQDGATFLARLLLTADMIEVFAGTAANTANWGAANPFGKNMKKTTLEALKAVLEERGKQVTLRWF